MAIKPIDLPSAAGIAYSGADVRHFSLGDAVNVPGLSNPTRNLAERDNLLAAKVNEIASVVNNQEQFIPLPVIRTTVPPSEEIIVTNYRIPAGFESRVLNAVVNTTPSSTNAQLNVQYSTSYGGASGTSVVTVTPGSEFTGDVNFYQTGEFIISLKNTGASTLEISASVMLTMRPLGAEGTLLVGSVIEGPEGKPGMTGPAGPPGPPGTGGAGSPGMVWMGNWSNGAAYNTNDVVAYNYSGTYGSWICRIANTANLGVNDPQTSAVIWNRVAIGIIGATGAAGPTGISNVSFTGNVASVQGTYAPQGGYSGAVYTNGLYTYNANAATTSYVTLQETFYGSTGGSVGSVRGLSSLNGMFFAAFSGEVLLTLPKKAYGALVDYDNTSINCMAMSHGTNWLYFTGSGTFTKDIIVRKSSVDSFYIKTVEALPQIPVMIAVSGCQQVYNV